MNTDHYQDTNSSNMANMADGEDENVHMAEGPSLQSRKSRIKALSDVFPYLRELGSEEERIRIVAGVNLLRHLYRKQKESEGAPISSELSYTLKRLIRGVCTRHIQKRAGFFSMLVEILKSFDVITTEDVMDIAKHEFDDEESQSKKVSAETYTGRLFAIGALIRAGTFLRASSEQQANIVERLVNIGQSKSSFSPGVYSILIELMKQIDDKKFKKVVWLHLKPELSKTLEEHTIDSLYILLEGRYRFPNVVKEKFLCANLGSKEILSNEFMKHCSKLLMDAPVNILNNHALYEALVPKLASSHLLLDFWEVLVQEVEKGPTPQKEKALINCIVEFVPLFDKKQIPEVLCDGFLDLICKIFQNRKNNAELITKICGLLLSMTTILNCDEVDEEIKITFIKRLMLFPGPFTFDAMDGIKIIVQLWPSMSVIGMEEIGSMLKNIILSIKPKVKNLEGETCPWNKRERSYAIKLLSKLLSITVQEEKLKWKIKELKFLVSQGFISTSKADDVVNLDIASEIRNGVFKVLDPAVSPKSHSIKVLSSLVDHINNLIFSKENSSKWNQHLSESSIAAWKKMFQLVKNLQSVENNRTELKKSGKELFIILFLHMGLQLLRDATLAEDALQELHCCYERTQDDTTNSTKNRRSIKNEEDEPHWVEVMVDLFLSLLSRNSALHRNIVGSVFPHLCPYLTATSIHQLLKVLDPNAEKTLYHDDSEDEESDESSDESEAENDNPSIGDEGKEDDEEDDDDDDLEYDDEPVNDQLKIAVQNALKRTMNNSKDSDEESIDMDQMTKEERDRLDAALSEAFKLLKYTESNRKTRKQSKDDETLMCFRIRVIDLIVVYLSNKPNLGLVLDIILPLFDLLGFCIKDNHQVSLEKRVRSCLMKLCQVRQFSSVNGVSENVISEVLAKLLQKGQRVAAVYQIMKIPLCKCATFLVRTSLHIVDQESHQEGSKSSPILDVYKEALVSFFTNRDSLLPVEVFGNVLAISWKGAWTLANDILLHAFTSECRPFRRSQAFQLLNKFFCNRRLFINVSKDDRKALHSMEKSILKKTVEVLLNFVNGKQNGQFVVKERNIEELLRLLLSLRKIHHLIKGKESIVAHWDDVKEAIGQYWQSQTFGNAIKSNIKKLASELNIELAEKNYSAETGPNKQNRAVGEVELQNCQQVDEDEDSSDSSEDNGDKGYESGNGINDENDNGEEQPVKKRKRSKSDDSKTRSILKKKAKYARLAAMSDGLEGSCNFSQYKLQEETPERDVKFSDKRKRKKSAREDGKHRKAGDGENSQSSEEGSGRNEKLQENGWESEMLERDSEVNEMPVVGGKRSKDGKTKGEVKGTNILVSKYDKKLQLKLERNQKKMLSGKTSVKHKEEEVLCR